MKKAPFRFVFALLAVVALSGCASYEDNARDLRGHWTGGRLAEANTVAGTALQSAGENELLLWQLERGSTLRACGNAAEASEEYEKAAATAARWEETPDVLLSSETLATLTNLSALPYRGRSSDVIMLHAYRALAFLEAGNVASARVALNAAYQAQRDAVDRNAKEIENAQAEAKENSVDVDALLQQSGLDKTLEAEKAELASVRVLADCVNPFATWLHGIYFLHTGTDGSDSERARVSLSRVAKMYPENPYIAPDEKLAGQNAPAENPLTYVIFESGCAPIIGTTRVDTAISVPTGRGYWTLMPISIALPKLVLSAEQKYWNLPFFASGAYVPGDATPSSVPALSANGVPASEICDMNSVVRTDFDNAYPAILTRTLITAFLKSAAAAALNAASQEYAQRDGSTGSALISLATMIGSAVYTYASTDADVRCWQTLPQNFSIVRMATPSSRRVTVNVGGRSREVELLPGEVNLVVVKTTHEYGPLVVSQAVLK